MKIGVLALQGAFREHGALLRRCGADVDYIRLPRQLAPLDGLVIPGGESTTMAKLIQSYGFTEPLLSFARSGKSLFGTCAGAILLSRPGAGPLSLNLIDASLARNAYGRQIHSREAEINLSFAPEEPFNALFIRAPVIESAGSSVTILARYRDMPVLARQGQVLIATFHPELTRDDRVHRYFLEQVTEGHS